MKRDEFIKGQILGFLGHDDNEDSERRWKVLELPDGIQKAHGKYAKLQLLPPNNEDFPTPYWANIDEERFFVIFPETEQKSTSIKPIYQYMETLK